MAKNQNRIRNRWELITCGLGDTSPTRRTTRHLLRGCAPAPGWAKYALACAAAISCARWAAGAWCSRDAPLIMRGKALGRQAIISSRVGVELASVGAMLAVRG